MHAEEIDQIRTRVWIAEIRSLTGLQAIHALAARLDSKSTWRDGNGIPHQSKWYRYEKGDATPSEVLISKVNAALPALSFDIRHPAWSLLRKPAPSQKTIDRLVHKMPAAWRQILNQLNDEPFHFRSINLELVTKYSLTSMSYLDAFLLFELARRDACYDTDEKDENLMFIILALPLLYIDDPIWKLQDISQKKLTLHAIVQSLNLSRCYSRDICFPEDHLVRAMAMQRILLKNYLSSHPRAQKSQSKKICLLAKCLGDNIDERYAKATSAFLRESPDEQYIRMALFGPDLNTQSMWNSAWSWLEKDPKFSHFATCFSNPPVE